MDITLSVDESIQLLVLLSDEINDCEQLLTEVSSAYVARLFERKELCESLRDRIRRGLV